MIPTIVDLTAKEPNFNHGRQGHRILAIVNHIMQGSLTGTDAWFENKKTDVSAQYGVGGGIIHKYVNDADTSWGAGVLNNPTSPLVLSLPGVDPNLYVINIEHAGYSGDPMPEDEYQTTLWLHKDLIKSYEITIDIVHILPHSSINTLHGGCPGPTFPWDRLFKDLKSI